MRLRKGETVLVFELTIRLQSHVVLLSQGGGQHGVVPGLESQAGKLTGVLKKSLAGNTGC